MDRQAELRNGMDGSRKLVVGVRRSKVSDVSLWDVRVRKGHPRLGRKTTE